MGYLTSEERVEYRSEVSRLRKNISRRVKRIEKQGPLADQSARKLYKEINFDLLKNRKDPNYDTYLKSILDTLKSFDNERRDIFTVKGAIERRANISRIIDPINSLSEDAKKNFWKIFDKATADIPLYCTPQYKYHILELQEDFFSEVYLENLSDEKVEELASRVTRALNNAYESSQMGGFSNGGNFDVYLSRELYEEFGNLFEWSE